MQTARIPLAILIALELAASAGCTSVGPCLSPVVPPPADDEGDDGRVGPCLDVAEDPIVGPCLTPLPPDPPVGPCLEVSPPEPPPKDPEVGPCLRVAPPEPKPKPKPKPEPKNKPKPPLEPGLGPCLMVLEPEAAMGRPKPTPAIDAERHGAGTRARADMVEKLADSLPPDVLAKLRDREK
ncbi:MAG: hypothetical protein ACE37F_03185 [Nannocystaceae bacterium]|nr:hypothetical protein [bacterium]